MSNEFVVLLAIVVAALGGGMSVACYFLAKQNEYLKEESNLLAQDFGKLVEELALAKENHIRNGEIAKEYQILCGDLEEECDDRRMFMGLLQADIEQLNSELQALKARS
jgi:hypothetical protein